MNVAVSGAGKTYTMLGKDDNPGIMAHALTELFTQMRRSKDEHVYKVTMSYLEVQSQSFSTNLLFHRLTHTAYLYNGRLAWYNVVLTLSLIHI